MNDYKTISDYNMKAQLELIDKQAQLLKMMSTPVMMVTDKTVRDEFAMAALFGVNTKEFDPKEIASKAFAIADAMMEARK
jgi:hypothetical protein